ncbi:hypothetical protein CTI12_AA617420 [Artemisia annua]|uniref:Uncharacterized protein n=1 Tax=Artemisia annua TaxID=35608 RepID=A0A2U1KCV6_ARTAN|nr:hypothetical protein CTI12_AA617420 [Artemisia annua]
MDYLVDDYDQALNPLRQCNNISSNLINDLWLVLYKLHQQKRFSKPMPWIGIYIAVASLWCILAMVADLIHGLKNRKLWLPSKYFSLDAASLTVIAVAVKLPLDLNNPMPGAIDQQAKLGSVAFMCIMMSFILPSLATMEKKEPVTNTIALGLLVITLVVNVCIQINTGLISNSEDMHITEYNMGGHTIKSKDMFGYANREIAIIYVALLLMLLMIYICSVLMIIKAKQDLESNYQAVHVRESIFQQLAGPTTFENVKQRVINYGIMAETGTPQFMISCSATSSASAVIGVSISLLHLIKTFNSVVNERRYRTYNSDYKWSILVIFIIQSIGIVLGAIALLFRFLAPLTFKLSTEGISKLINFYEVESCWTHTLSDWKRNILHPPRSNSFKFVFYELQILGHTLLTLSQKATVITCKAIRIIPVLISLCVSRSVFWLVSLFGIQLRRQPETNRDFRQYLLQPQDNMELADVADFAIVTINFIIKSVERSIQNLQNQQPSKLVKLLENSRDFEGVKKFDSLFVQSDYPNCWSLPVVTLAIIAHSLQMIQPRTLKNFLNGNLQNQQPSKLVKLLENSRDFEGVKKFDSLFVQSDYPNCWSLPVVTLAIIAHSLQMIQPRTLKNFLNGVREGLVYVKLVEKSLKNKDELVSVQNAAESLWQEVEVYHKWLGNNLQDPDFRGKTAKQIVEQFNEKATNMVTVGGSSKDICANSMRRVTQTILLIDNINKVSQEELLIELSSMISDILAACLTNLPQIIVLKCHTNKIKKRKECVHAAATLLGKSSEILNTLQDRELPSLNPGELPFIDKWRDHLTTPAP